MFIALGMLRHYHRKQSGNAVDAPGPSRTPQNKKFLPSSGCIPALVFKCIGWHSTGDMGLTAQARLSNWNCRSECFQVLLLLEYGLEMQI